MKISNVEIQGFRAFGKVAQTLKFNSPIACVWGPNSQGKTSLAEAIEFLITGQIVRRELMSSTQDEFADALRNVHMPKNLPVYVEMTLIGTAGPRAVRRSLTADYGKKRDCQTVLQIDGHPATEADLAALGMVLSQPPLRASVLAQHTLSYLFSAKPQERASYFKALLEVVDLDTLRASVAVLEQTLPSIVSPLFPKLAIAAEIPAVANLKTLSAKVPARAVLDKALSTAITAVMKAEGQAVSGTLAEQADALATYLAGKRTETFPVNGFDKKSFAVWSPTMGEQLASLTHFLTERDKVDQQTRQLAALFVEALALPSVARISNPVDCPLCAAQAALTPERVAFIQGRVADNTSFSDAEKVASKAVQQLHDVVVAVRKQLFSALPQFMVHTSAERRQRGFRIDRLYSLLGDVHTASIAAWLKALKQLVRIYKTISRPARQLVADLAEMQDDLNKLDDIAALTNRCNEAIRLAARFHQALISYLPLEMAVVDALNAVIDAQSQTKGWRELIDIARDPAGLRVGLVEAAALAHVRKDLTQALRQIDTGNEKVAEEKFSALSDGVATWWDLLRPDELSFFSALRPRAGARRTIDFKAGLSAHEDRSSSSLRDVIAVFSQSQLHCLGLALFLARAVHEKTGFVVLDDPILSSDEGYRTHFNTAVLEKLLDGGMQVILLTQDQKTCKDVTELYLHRQIDTFQINLSNPADGTTVINKADDLAALIERAGVLVRGGHPDLLRQCGEGLRNAAERLCKEILVKDQRAKGNKTFTISSYDHKVLGELGPIVEPLLTSDPSHPGKLRVMTSNLNPAKHDDAFPAVDTLKVALGNLKMFKKTYL